MDQNHFFGVRQAIRLEELAASIGANLSQCDAGERMVESIAPVSRAGPLDICYILSKKSASDLEYCHAAAVICTPSLKSIIPDRIPTLISDSPKLAFAKASAELYPAAMRPQAALGDQTGISEHAIVDETAIIEAGAEIAPFVVIGANVSIGSGTRVLSGAVIGAGVKIGRNVTIGVQVSVTNALIGNNVIIHTGVRIGQDGFGYAGGSAGMVKLPQVGRVIIQDDVEIGANTTIDRGAMDDTIIGEGTKIDNLVQIGHNVQIGRHCGIVSQVGIAGSAKIGDGVMIGGQVGVAGHITLGNGVQIAAQSGVVTSIPDGTNVGGTPARPLRDYLREVGAILMQSSKSRSVKGE